MSTIPADVRERIIQAAHELYEKTGREKMPTVDEVRRTARVDMNSASAVMREWRKSQTAQAAPLAVTVPEVVSQASAAALVSLWQTAQELANESLRGAQAAWEVERVETDRERQELAEAYERQATELEEVREQLEAARSQREKAVANCAQLGEQLEQSRATLIEQRGATEQAKARAQEIEQRATDLRAELDRAHNEQERTRDELAAAQARAERAEAATQAAEQRAAGLAAELAAEQARGERAALIAQTELTAMQGRAERAEAAAQAAERLREDLAKVREELAATQALASDARERAAGLAGKLESEQAHTAALLARLDNLPQQEVKQTKAKTPKEPKA